jgi:hypothetical protein
MVVTAYMQQSSLTNPSNSSNTALTTQPKDTHDEGEKGGRVERWKTGRVEEGKGGRGEGWKKGRVEGWKGGRVGRGEGWKGGRVEGFDDIPAPVRAMRVCSLGADQVLAKAVIWPPLWSLLAA